MQVIQSVDRALQVLEIVGESVEPVSLGDLTSALGIDRSSVHRLAQTLRQRGYLIQLRDSKHYTLGSAIWRLSRRLRWPDMLGTLSRDSVVELAKEVGETAHLAVREEEQVVFVEQQLASRPVGVTFGTSRVEPLYCTALGKALLADCGLAELRSIFQGKSIPVMTRKTINSLDKLATECERARRNGYAVDDEEFHEGVRCVAAPVRDASGEVVAAIGVSAPANRLPRSRLSAVGATVLRAATTLSERLGSMRESQTDDNDSTHSRDDRKSAG